MAECTAPNYTCNTTEEEVREIEATVYTCTWELTNFPHLHPGVGNFISDKYDTYDEHLWIVCLYPDGYDSYCSSSVGVFVQFNRNLVQLDHLPYQLRIYIVDKYGNEVEEHRSEEKRTDTHVVKNFFAKYSLIVDQHRKDLLRDGTLTLKFKAFFLDEEVDRHRPDGIVSPGDEAKLQGLEPIFNNDKFSDVKIAVGNKLFYVYKGILASQSPVFAAMFEHDMKENNENIVQIIDADPAVIEQLLRFTYAGKVNDIGVVARDLLVAADQYQMEKLKRICEEALIKDLSEKTVSSLLIHADKYGAEVLKKRALMYFKKHAKEVIQTDEYLKNINSLIPLLPEIIERLVL